MEDDIEVRNPIIFVQCRHPDDRHAAWQLSCENDEAIIIRDIGLWEKRLTVTNDAEYVVQEVLRFIPELNGRKIYYFDSGDNLTELKYDKNGFTGFAPVYEPVKPSTRVDQLIIEDE